MEATPPPAITLTWEAPRASCSRVRWRTASGLSATMAALARSPKEYCPASAGSSLGRRKSPWPPDWEIMAPAGQIRGPLINPMSIPFLRPNTGPPRSRALVKPRISMSLAALVAATVVKVTSLVSTAICGRVANIRWVWASMRPGIRVLPWPSIRCTSPSTLMPPWLILVIRLPSTRTEEGALSALPLPSKIRTFSNKMAA
ncbi:hypothetical protein D3C76_1044490 [compost metagenome]